MSRATTRRALATPPESGARPASGTHRKASPSAAEQPAEQPPAAHAPAPPAAPAASPLRLAPAHAALVTSMLEAFQHLGDLARSVRDLEVTLRSETAERVREEAQDIAEDIRDQLEFLSWELTNCCDTLTGVSERNVIGCALNLARLQSGHRQGDDDPNRQSMNEAMASLARRSFERTGAA